MRLLALACAAGVAAAPATTVPGVLYKKKLVITNERIIISGKRFETRNGWERYPRGADIRYDVRNGGTRPFKLEILGASTGMLAPGKQSTILVYWDRRGRYTFRAVPDGPRMHVWIS